MYSRVHSQKLNEEGETLAEGKTIPLEGTVGYFRSIPPERIGLHGEYDHSGLVKRVEQAFRQHFQLAELEHLSIMQRGSVVVLAGWVLNQAQLDQLVTIALSLQGANYVETHDVRLLEGEQFPSSAAGRWSVTPSLPVVQPIELERWSA